MGGSRDGPPRWAEVQQELSRSRAARRAGPWLLGTSLAAGLLVALAGRSPAAGLSMLVPGALFWLLLGATARPRCPACGANLFVRGDRPGSAARPRQTRVERERRCPGCGVSFAG